MREFLRGIFFSSISLIALIVTGILIFYLASLSKMKKQKEHFRKIHLSLREGSRVIFAGGIYGCVVRMEGDVIDVKIKSGAIMSVSRYAVSEILEEKK